MVRERSQASQTQRARTARAQEDGKGWGSGSGRVLCAALCGGRVTQDTCPYSLWKPSDFTINSHIKSDPVNNSHNNPICLARPKGCLPNNHQNSCRARTITTTPTHAAPSSCPNGPVLLLGTTKPHSSSQDRALA
ncbi:hypothetical protein FJTKL_02686 [Diaporthe vaccinii]|uniref:Uncharacterized protein n=1 Tax=Diaporthe vaccinii TaxID=105482 RepID=A0ABR4DXG3_9PEZI